MEHRGSATAPNAHDYPEASVSILGKCFANDEPRLWRFVAIAARTSRTAGRNDQCEAHEHFLADAASPEISIHNEANHRAWSEVSDIQLQWCSRVVIDNILSQYTL